MGLEKKVCLITDLSGFSNLVHDLQQGPNSEKKIDDFEKFLEDIYRELNTPLRDYGGEFLRTEGDSVFALFNSPEPAIFAALEQHKKIKEIKNKEYNLEPHSAVADGNLLKIEVGKEKRSIIIGPAIENARLLEKKSEKSQIVASVNTSLEDYFTLDKKEDFFVIHKANKPFSKTMNGIIRTPKKEKFEINPAFVIAGELPYLIEESNSILNSENFDSSKFCQLKEKYDLFADIVNDSIKEHSGKLVFFDGHRYLAFFTGQDKEERGVSSIFAIKNMLKPKNIGVKEQNTGISVSGILTSDNITIGNAVNRASKLAFQGKNGIYIPEEDTKSITNLITMEDAGTRQFGRKDEVTKICRVTGKTKKIEKQDYLIGRESEFESLCKTIDNLGKEPIAIVLEGTEGMGKSSIIRKLEKLRKSVKAEALSYQKKPYLLVKQILDKGRWNIMKEEQDYIDYLRLEKAGANIDALNPEQLEAKINQSLVNIFSRVDAPTMFVFEDLHWADEESLAAFHYLSENLKNNNIALIGTFRPELNEESKQRLKTSCSNIQLESLADEKSHELISYLEKTISPEKKIDDTVRKKIIKSSNGVPFYIHEIFRYLEEKNNLNAFEAEIPEKIKDVVYSRFKNLNPSAQEFLEKASVIGKDFDINLLKSLLEKELNPETLKILQERKFIDTNKKGYSFHHPSHQEVIYARIAPRDKEALHAHLADKIIETYPEPLIAGSLELIELVMDNYAKGEIEETAARWAFKGVESAFSKGLYKTATKKFIEKGLEFNKNTDKHQFENFWRDYSFRARWCESLIRDSKLEQAIEVCKSIGTEFIEKLDKESQKKLNRIKTNKELILGKCMLNKQEYAFAKEIFLNAEKMAEDSSDDLALLAVYKDLARLGCKTDQTSETIYYSQKAMPIAEKLNNEKYLSGMYLNLGGAYNLEKNYNLALEFYEKSRALAEKLDNKENLASVYNDIADTYIHLAQPEEALGCLFQALKLLGRAENESLEKTIKENISVAYFAAGDRELGEKVLNELFLLCKETGDQTRIDRIVEEYKESKKEKI